MQAQKFTTVLGVLYMKLGNDDDSSEVEYFSFKRDEEFFENTGIVALEAVQLEDGVDQSIDLKRASFDETLKSLNYQDVGVGKTYLIKEGELLPVQFERKEENKNKSNNGEKQKKEEPKKKKAKKETSSSIIVISDDESNNSASNDDDGSSDDDDDESDDDDEELKDIEEKTKPLSPKTTQAIDLLTPPPLLERQTTVS
jgi:hypothetical protein